MTSGSESTEALTSATSYSMATTPLLCGYINSLDSDISRPRTNNLYNSSVYNSAQDRKKTLNTIEGLAFLSCTPSLLSLYLSFPSNTLSHSHPYYCFTSILIRVPSFTSTQPFTSFHVFLTLSPTHYLSFSLPQFIYLIHMLTSSLTY